MWYKWSGVEILEAPSLDLPGGIHLDETTQDQSPVQGWHWFNTVEEAQVLNPNPPAVQVNLMAVSRDAEVAGLEAFEESLTAAGLPLTMAKLKAAQIAGVNEKIDYMTANGGLG